MKTTVSPTKHRKVLVIDIGGSNVKLIVFGATERRRFKSGPGLTPAQMTRETLALTRDWHYDVVSIGFPAPVANGKPAGPPNNLGRGWVGFDFQKRFGKPVRIINDAAMQALGSYRGGRMLFIGLGTGLGSALIANDVIIPLELCNLPCHGGESLEYYLCKESMKVIGKTKWRRLVNEIVPVLKSSFVADEVVIGGGNAKYLKEPLPDGVRLGHNRNAFRGGHRLWDAKTACKGSMARDSWMVG